MHHKQECFFFVLGISVVPFYVTKCILPKPVYNCAMYIMFTLNFTRSHKLYCNMTYLISTKSLVTIYKHELIIVFIMRLYYCGQIRIYLLI